MAEFFGSIWWLLVALGLLITFHEFGHFWVARRMGVKVLTFSVGFGRALWSRTGSDGTQYVIAALPLGGYVKMLDEREGEVPEDQLDQAFNRKSVWARIAIVAAGPIFNFVFAVLAFWVMFMVGTPERHPIIGEVQGIAAEAGLEPGDQIVALDDSDVQTWTHAVLGLIPAALDREPVAVTVQDAAGNRITRTLPLQRLGSDFEEQNALAEIGITPWRAVLPPIVDTVSPDSPAEEAGFRSGDRVLSVGGEEVPSWGWVGHLAQVHGAENEPLAVMVERNGEAVELTVRPALEKSGWFSSRLILGITPMPPDPELEAAHERAVFMLRYGPIESIGAAFRETGRLTASTLGLLGRMLTGKASVKNLSGPISIAQFANDSAAAGLSSFLFFLGLISLSLAILNLLPIPVLDGGHLLFYGIEAIRGKPVSDRTQAAGQYFGLIALAGLMSLAFVNDILRLIG